MSECRIPLDDVTMMLLAALFIVAAVFTMGWLVGYAIHKYVK